MYKRSVAGLVVWLVLAGATARAADVWTFQLEKVQPVWDTGTNCLLVPVKITVYLDIDGQGVQEYGATIESARMAWGADIGAALEQLTPRLQAFITKCKRERAAMKSAQFTALLASLTAALTI